MTRPTRLLLVTNTYPTPDRPQMGPFVALRVEVLRHRGVEVVVAGPSSYRRNSALRHLGIAWRALRARGPFDGVEAHPLYAAGVIGLIAARLRRRPLVAYAHGGDVADYAVRSRVHRTLARWVARGAAAVVVNSRDTAGYVERFGVAAEVVSPGVDLGRFAPATAPERQAARLLLGLPDGPLVLLLGALSERKGADVFAAALDLAPGWRGVAVGDGPLAGELERRGPGLIVRPPVPASEVPGWLRAVDAVAVPSRREPLGLAAVEALACGTPVVASATGGLLEVVRDGENGLLVQPDDAEALAGALKRLLDPRLRARLAAAGPGSVAGHDADRAGEAMAEIWDRLGVRA
jgi:glycosyltransferase involved in cell wall biosynthesis